MSDLLTPASEMPADDMAIAEARTRHRGELLSELAQAINSTSTENASNTPDFILANFAAACLDAFAEASLAREAWYGKSLSIDGETSDIAAIEARTPIDDPELDGTDFAHPAWFRGYGQSLAEFCCHVDDILDGKDDGKGENFEGPWRELRKRLVALVAKPAPTDEDTTVKVGENDYADFENAENPAPATDVDALLAEAEHWARLTRKLTPDVEKGCAHVLRLATALRESRAREVAERERDALAADLAAARAELGALGLVEWEWRATDSHYWDACPHCNGKKNCGRVGKHRAIRVVKEATEAAELQAMRDAIEARAKQIRTALYDSGEAIARVEDRK